MSIRRAVPFAVVACVILAASPTPAESPIPSPRAPDGWRTAAPRDELRPAFAYDPRGGRSGAGAFVIAADGREGLHGSWVKDFPVAGGKAYQFRAYRKVAHVESPRRSALVR